MAELAKLYSGVQKKRSADDEAKQMRHKAAARRAESGSAAREERRQGRIKKSRAQAVAAAGGGSLADPTIVNLMGDLEAESEYRALTRLYEGEEEALGLETGAKIRKREGKVALVTSVLSSADSLSGKYG